MGLGSIGSVAQAAPFTGVYQFTSGPTEVPVQTGMTFGEFTRLGDLQPVSTTGDFTNSNWNGNPDPAGIEFVLTPDSGYVLDITGIEFRSARSSDGPTFGQLLVSVDGFTTASQFTWNPPTSIGTSTWDLADLTNITGPAIFRIYGYNSTSDSGTLSLDDFTISGNLVGSAVPEPTTFGLLSIAALGILRRHR